MYAILKSVLFLEHAYLYNIINVYVPITIIYELKLIDQLKNGVLLFLLSADKRKKIKVKMSKICISFNKVNIKYFIFYKDIFNSFYLFY